jgi:hypothetical protein
MGIEPRSPVAGFGVEIERKTLGFQAETVNGDEIEFAVTPVCVPPREDTAHCFAFTAGGVSAVNPKVGDATPVYAVPAIEESGVKLTLFSKCQHFLLNE